MRTEILFLKGTLFIFDRVRIQNPKDNFRFITNVSLFCLHDSSYSILKLFTSIKDFVTDMTNDIKLGQPSDDSGGQPGGRSAGQPGGGSAERPGGGSTGQPGGESSNALLFQPGSSNPNLANIFKVSVKYSPFNREDPEIWFTQLEAQFQLAGVTVDGTKYGHLIAALDNETIQCVRDKVLHPPNANKYESLKGAITSRICDSEKIKLNKLLSGVQLGDKKPSQLLREMQALSTGQINDAVLQNLWLQRLPTQVQQILTCMENMNLENLSVTADKIIEVSKPIDICSVSPLSNLPVNSKNQIGELKSCIDALSKRFDSFVHESRGRSQAKSTPNSNDRRDDNRSKSRSRKQADLYPNCWYHFKFGSRAKKCIKPCLFNSSQSKN